MPQLYSAASGNNAHTQQAEAVQAEKRRREEEERQRRLAEDQARYARITEQAQQAWAEAMARANRGYQAGDMGAAGNALRGRQLGSLDALQAAADGRAPSVAGQQYRANLAQAQRQAMGVAAGQRGAGRGAARLQAVSAFGSQAGQQAAQQAAMEAAERQQAAALYAQSLQGARGQDIGLAGMQEDANRGAFDSTTSAQLGAIQTALGGGQLGLGAANGATQVSQFDQSLALERERQRQQRQLAWLQLLAGTGATLATKK